MLNKENRLKADFLFVGKNIEHIGIRIKGILLWLNRVTRGIIVHDSLTNIEVIFSA